MKNLSIILNVVLIIAVGVLYYLHFSSRNAAVAPAEQSVAAEDSTGSEPVTQTIVYVNTDSLLANYEYFKNNRAALEEKSRKAETDLATRARNLENEYAAAQQRAQSGSLTQEQGMRLEQQLMQKQQDLVQYRDNVTRKLMEEEQKLTQELNDNITEFLKTYGKDKGYKFVLGYTRGGSNVLYGGDELDVTTEILQGLNEQYTKAQAPAPAKK